jgi:hypothetical protein
VIREKDRRLDTREIECAQGAATHIQLKDCAVRGGASASAGRGMRFLHCGSLAAF